MAYTDIPKGANADYYLSGRARALYRLDYPAAQDPPVGTPAWWSNEGIKDAWAKLKSRVGGTEPTLYGEDGQPLPLKLGVPDPRTGIVPPGPYDSGNGQRPQVYVSYGQPGQGGQPNVRVAGPTDSGNGQRPQVYVSYGQAGRGGQPNIRVAPAYRGPGGIGGVYLPPPGPVLTTKEVYGSLRGRLVPVFTILERDGMRNHVIRGGRVYITSSSREGFNLAGTPGSWNQASPGVSPGAFGLDPYVGVVAFDGRRARPLDAYTLGQLLGPGWQAIVAAAA